MGFQWLKQSFPSGEMFLRSLSGGAHSRHFFHPMRPSGASAAPPGQFSRFCTIARLQTGENQV